MTIGELYSTLIYIKQLEDEIEEHHHDRACSKTAQRHELADKIYETIKRKQSIVNQLKEKEL